MTDPQKSDPKNQSSAPTGIILPLNMPLAEYVRRFEIDLATNNVQAVTYFLFDGPPDQIDRYDELLAIANGKMDEWKTHLELVFVEERMKVYYLAKLDFIAFRTPDRGQLKYSPTSLLAKWAVEGVRIQTGFVLVDPQKKVREQAIITGMDSLDMLFEMTGTFEPSAHEGLVAPVAIADAISAAVGDFYLSKKGIWCRNLVAERSRWMIRNHCWLTGRDPDDEYQRFLDAGGTYYLEYPRLCP